MKNIKKKVLVIFVIFSIILLTACSRPSDESSKADTKFVGSKHTESIHIDYEIYSSVKEMLQDSDLIVIAHYSDTPNNIKTKSENYTLESSRYNLIIDEVIYGESKAKNIVFSQMGAFDTDNYETKIKKDKKYILFLKQKPNIDEVVYDSAGSEQGIVEILDDDTLLSYFDEGISDELNKMKVDKIKSEISDSAKSISSNS